MNKTNKILLVSLIILIVILIVLFIYQRHLSDSDFYAVYLRTGDLYFGQLTFFPFLGLREVYFLQANSSDPQNPVNLRKFTDAVWGPEDFIKINSDQLVWITKIDSNSRFLQAIRK